MGQSASSERPEPHGSRRDTIHRLSQRLRNRHGFSSTAESSLDSSVSSSAVHHPQSRQGRERALPFATFSRQISAQSIPVRDNFGHTANAQAQDRYFYQQQEERPLVHMEDLGMRNAPITHITASPMPRRLSTISRLTSRVTSRHSIIGTPEPEHGSPGESRTLRRRLSERLSTRATEEGSLPSTHRLSILSPLSRHSSMTSHPRRRRELAPISGPFPLMLDGSAPAPSFLTATSERRHGVDALLPTQQTPQPRPRDPSTNTSRLSRARHSLSLPFESVRPLSRLMSSQSHSAQTPPERPSRAPHQDEPDYFLPPLAVADTRFNMDTSVLQTQIPEDGEQPAEGFTPTLQASEETSAVPDRGTLGNVREGRRIPNMLRGRSSRLIRRPEDGPLPRILHLAAVAIAAQLSGNPDQAITNLQAVGADGVDDSLNNLFRTLHEATDTQPTEGPSDSATSLGSLPPLNFLRVFRFVNNNRDANTTESNPSPEDQMSGSRDNPMLPDEDTADGTDGRTVTLVVVGVRSVPSDHIGHEDMASAGPSLEALLNMPLPATAPSNVFRNSGPGSFLRRSDGRSRLPRPRRASLGVSNPFPINYGRQRLHRFNSSPQDSGISTPATASGSVSGQSDLPAGSHPPPSTPAESGLSPYSSGTTTPSRRPSSASALHAPPVSARDMAYDALDEPRSSGSEQHVTHPVHQRRRSDSEFARHRNLGAGAARRNGVVAPDGVENDNNMPSGSRSWLIYVVGTNISENHPALTTPSLFTDNPTYEDMLLLSSLLGSAKPPVASRDDVASAPGVYQLRKSAGNLVAAALQGPEHIGVVPGERCLVCLCDYEAGEEIRQLSKCNHLFHRECIDE
ncbi:MAG: hypothetical protein Q9222_006242, partial [Ikaeria aurantiellina]